MPSFPIKLHGKYAIWSTVCDQPVTPFVESLDELRQLAPHTVGETPQKALDLLERTGVPYPSYTSAEHLAENNLAGDATNEYTLSTDQLMTTFANTENGRRRAARNLETVDQAMGLIAHKINELNDSPKH